MSVLRRKAQQRTLDNKLHARSTWIDDLCARTWLSNVPTAQLALVGGAQPAAQARARSRRTCSSPPLRSASASLVDASCGRVLAFLAPPLSSDPELRLASFISCLCTTCHNVSWDVSSPRVGIAPCCLSITRMIQLLPYGLRTRRTAVNGWSVQ